MAEIREEDGRFFRRRAGSVRWEEVSPEVADAEGMSRMERFGRSALGGAEGLVRGGVSLLDRYIGDPRGPMAPDTAEMNEARLGELRARQEAIEEVDPTASWGEVLPELVAPVGRGLRGAMAIEAAIGAARQPEAPIQGAAQGALIGGGLYGAGALAGAAGRRLSRGTRRGLEAGQAVVNRSRQEGVFQGLREQQFGRQEPPLTAAAEARPGAAAPGARRQLEGAADAQTMHEAGFPMATTHARILNEADPAAFARLRDADVAEEVASRTDPDLLTMAWRGVTGEEPVNRQQLMRDQQQWLNRQVAEEMGLPNRTALTPDVVDGRRKEISAEFERLIAETPGPIDMRGMGDEWEKILDDHSIFEGNKSRNTLERIWTDLASRADKTGFGRIADGDPRSLAVARNSLTERINQAADRAGQQEVAEALGALREALDRRIQRDWTPEMKDRYRTAQRQWHVVDAAHKSRAATSARGDVNLPSFMSNYEGAGNSRTTALLHEVAPEFLAKLRAAGAVMAKEVGDTGSGQTAVAGLGRKLGKAGLAAAGGGAAGGLLSDLVFGG